LALIEGKNIKRDDYQWKGGGEGKPTRKESRKAGTGLSLDRFDFKMLAAGKTFNSSWREKRTELGEPGKGGKSYVDHISLILREEVQLH